MAGYDERDVNLIVDGLYQSALGEKTWLESLGELRNLFGARSAQLFTGRSRGGALDFPYSVRAFDSDAPRTDSGKMFSDNWRGFELGTDPRMLYAATKAPGEIYFDHQFISDDEIARHPFYQEFLAQFESKYHMGVNLNVETDEIVAMTLNWDCKQGHATRHQSEMLSLLVPHVQRAFRVSESLKQAHSARDSLLGILSQTETGVALLDSSGSVLDINGKFEQFIRDRDGITYFNRRIAFAGDPANRQIDKLWGLALNRFGVDSTLIRDELVARPSGKRPYVLNLIPIGVASLSYRGKAALVLTVVDPARGSSLSKQLMQRYFKMTSAEAIVAIEIGNGLSIEELASKNGVAVTTIRSQLKSVFEKTDTHRQSELASLLSKLPGDSSTPSAD